MLSATTLLENIYSDVFGVREKMTVSEWADRNREIMVGDAKGRWDTNRTPYLRGVMDALGDSRYRRVTFMKAAQIGGSEAGYNGLFYFICEDPGDTLFVYPNVDMARNVNRRRFLPTLRETKAVAQRLGGSPRDAQSLELVFDRMTLAFTGSNSQANLESFPYRRVFIDELDRCAADTGELVNQRVKTFPDSLIVNIGSPGLEGVGIDVQYYGEMDEDGHRRGGSDRRQYWVPCPHCGVYHLRLWKNVRWDKGLKAPPMVVLNTAWILCPTCEKAITADKNMWQCLLGRWAREGERVTDLGGNAERGTRNAETGEGGGMVVGGENLPPNNHAGFKIGGLYNTLIANPYGFVASEFVKNQGEYTQVWVNSTNGDSYKPRGDAADIVELKKRAAMGAAAGIRYGGKELPAWALVIILVADVQGDRMWLEYTCWGAGGKDMLGFLALDVPRKQGMDLSELDAWAVKRFKTADGRTLRPLLVGLDTGKYTDEGYNAVRRLEKLVPYARGVKGEYKERTDIPQQYSKPILREQGIQVLLVNTNYWKDHILARLRPGGESQVAEPQKDELDNPLAPQVEEGATVDNDFEPDRWHFGGGTPDFYLEQLTSEHCVAMRKDGRMRWYWKVRPGRTANHLLDCRTYACALAAQEGVRMLKTKKTEASQRASEPASQGAEKKVSAVSASIAEARESGMLAAGRR